MPQADDTGRQAGAKHCLITGASGGLGGALARRAAAPGLFLSLWGRNEERLEQVRESCQAKGAEAATTSLDVRDYASCRQAVRRLFAQRPVDMAILNAGVSSGAPPGGGLEPAEDACRVMEVDATAVVNMAAALLEGMQARGSGHIVFISSIAGLYPLPCSPAYSAAKAALAYYAQGLQLALRGSGIRASAAYPGYIESPMSQRLLGPQPFRLTADEAAAHILDALEAGKDRIVFPRLLALGTRLLHGAPQWAAAFFLKKFCFTVAPDAESPLSHKAGPSGEGDNA